MSWQGIQVGTDAMAAADITVTFKAAFARASHATPERQLIATSVLQVWHHFLLPRSYLYEYDRPFCDANWIVTFDVWLGMDSNYNFDQWELRRFHRLPPNETVRLGVTGIATMLVEKLRRGDAFRHAMSASAGRRIDDCDHHQSAHQANCS